MGLKCLSARFVIDMVEGIAVVGGRALLSLKCLSARFVIDIDIRGNGLGDRLRPRVSNAFRLDS